MKDIDIAYGTGLQRLSVPEKNLAGILSPEHHTACSEDEQKIIREALKHPVGTSTIRELAVGKQRVTVITSDHTRAVPSAITLPLILEEIRAGSPDAEITIIIATGLHRGMTHDEMLAKFGRVIVENERLINHDAFDPEMFIDLGILPSGSRCEINRLAVESDLLIAEGFIEPHFFAGFSGGRKSVLPGIASQACVNINHSAPAIASEMAATGVLDGNPIHEDMIEAARLAHLAFILNVLLDENKKVTAAFAGDVDEAHRAGCTQLLSDIAVDPVPADIVVTSNGGYPLDQNLYQCPKGLDAALASVKPDGVIILAAACCDGLGGENFGSLMLSAPPKELLERILAIPPEQTISEQWCAQRFSDALIRYHIILVSDGLDRKTTENMHFIYAETIQDALKKAFTIKGEAASVTVIPDGISVVVRR